MKKATLAFTFILVGLLSSKLVAAECQDGLSSSWEFNQKTRVIKLQSLNEQTVCSFVKKQMNANMEFTIMRNGEVIFSSRVFWSEVQHHEVLGQKMEMEPIKQKTLDYKIMKFPVKLKGSEKYKITHIKSGEVLGEGALK